MTEQYPFSRMERLYGPSAMEILRYSRVLLFGIGGVGGHCAEALARCGVRHFTLVDGDCVSITNMNRQAVALYSTLGQMKVDVMHTRILDINPDAQVNVFPSFYDKDHQLGLWDARYDMVLDAIDHIDAKVDIAWHAQENNVPCISCMGAGNKKNPTGFLVADLYETAVCPLARIMRKKCRERGITELRVIYSKETKEEQVAPSSAGGKGCHSPGSVAFVTASAGLMLASEAVCMLLDEV